MGVRLLEVYGDGGCGFQMWVVVLIVLQQSCDGCHDSGGRNGCEEPSQVLIEDDQVNVIWKVLKEVVDVVKVLWEGVVAKCGWPCLLMDVEKCHGSGPEQLCIGEAFVGNDRSGCQVQFLLLHEDVGDWACGLKVNAPSVLFEPLWLCKVVKVLCGLRGSDVEVMVNVGVVECGFEGMPIQVCAVDIDGGGSMISTMDHKVCESMGEVFDVRVVNPLVLGRTMIRPLCSDELLPVLLGHREDGMMMEPSLQRWPGGLHVVLLSRVYLRLGVGRHVGSKFLW